MKKKFRYFAKVEFGFPRWGKTRSVDYLGDVFAIDATSARKEALKEFRAHHSGKEINLKIIVRRKLED